MPSPLSSLTPDLVGRRYPGFTFRVEKGWVDSFCKHLGFEQNDSQQLVPDIFLACLRDAELHAFKHLGIGLSQLLHAQQSFEFKKAARIGDFIETQTEVKKILSKKRANGSFVILELETTFHREGVELASSSSTLFVGEPEQ